MKKELVICDYCGELADHAIGKDIKEYCFKMPVSYAIGQHRSAASFSLDLHRDCYDKIRTRFIESYKELLHFFYTHLENENFMIENPLS